MFCPYCGSELQFAQAEICPKCGMRIRNPGDLEPVFDKKLVYFSLVMGFLLPFIGVILAFYFLIKGGKRLFIHLLIESICFWLMWWGIFALIIR